MLANLEVELPVRPDGSVVDWGQQLRDAWDISESAALALMEKFMSEGAPPALNVALAIPPSPS